MQVTHSNRANEKVAAHIYKNDKTSCEVVVSLGHYEVGVIVDGSSVEVVTDTTSEKEPEPECSETNPTS